MAKHSYRDMGSERLPDRGLVAVLLGDLLMRAKINLSQQNQAVAFANRALFAHPTRETPVVKLSKTRVSSFNHALASARFEKSADPTCYNVPVAGNRACDRLFDIVRTA